jgi:hypothetical protein
VRWGSNCVWKKQISKGDIPWILQITSRDSGQVTVFGNIKYLRATFPVFCKWRQRLAKGKNVFGENKSVLRTLPGKSNFASRVAGEVTVSVK